MRKVAVVGACCWSAAERNIGLEEVESGRFEIGGVLLRGQGEYLLVVLPVESPRPILHLLLLLCCLLGDLLKLTLEIGRRTGVAGRLP